MYVTSTPSWLLSSSTTRQTDRADTPSVPKQRQRMRRLFPWTLLLQSNYINLTINHSLSYLQLTWMKISELTLCYRLFTTLSAISDSWVTIPSTSPFSPKLNNIDITSRLILDCLWPIWLKADELSLIQRKNGHHLGKLLITP
jgi:hypothetical protein